MLKYGFVIDVAICYQFFANTVTCFCDFVCREGGTCLGLSNEIDLSGIPLEKNSEAVSNNNGAKFLLQEGLLATNSIISSWVGSDDERYMTDMSYAK